MQILPNNKKAYNEKQKDNYVGVDLYSDFQQLNDNNMSATLDEFKQYLKESDASNKYRLICTIRPLCSNVLFNMCTEVVSDEDTDDCVFYGSNHIGTLSGNSLTYHQYKTNTTNTLSRAEALLDTGYSHKDCGKLVYHCGLDIFDNHYLRSKKFFIVNKLGTAKNKQDFNTIKDVQRDKFGEQVEDEHLYTIDELYGFNDAITEHLVERDGWFGFHNPTTLAIPNYISGDSEIVINKCMNSNKAYEMIDMYPDRSLFSFVPKYNKTRKRFEKNWEVCLTYPAASDKSSPLVSDTLNSTTTVYGIKCTYQKDYSTDTTISFKSQIHNTLQVGDHIHLFIIKKQNSTRRLIKVHEDFEIQEIGNGRYNADLFFKIDADDLKPYIGRNVSVLTGNTYEFRYVKVVRGVQCEYYFRKFKYLPDYVTSNVSTDEEISVADQEKCSKKPFKVVMGRLGFARTSYGDDIVELVFPDDINTTSLKDNLGREVSEIYLTIVKTNYGYKQWYNANPVYTGATIEASHCFGKVTSGLDLDVDEFDYNVHKIHNIPTGLTPYIPTSPQWLEDDITISGTTGSERMFLGDIVEFSPYTIQETVLENVYHRFNTGQREDTTGEYSALTYTEITDDGTEIGLTTHTFTTVRKDLFVSDVTASTASTVEGLELTVYPANLMPEGYMYKPHNRIELFKFADDVQQGEDVSIIFEADSLTSGLSAYTLTTAQNYYLSSGDTLFIYNYPTNDLITGTVLSVSGEAFNKIKITVPQNTIKQINKCLIFKPNPICPSTAYRLHDGTGRYIWRDKQSTADKLVELGEDMTTFTNGAHYRNLDLTFYLQRQDPNSHYALNGGDGTPCSVLNVLISGREKDVTYDDYEPNNKITTC